MKSEVEILLVEDNAADAELAIHALKKPQLASKLLHVVDGQAALAFLFGTDVHEGRDIMRQPKVVLLDLKLPKVDGIEVLRQIRANEGTRLLPVVVLTSSREDRDLLECYRLGANSYIVKPVGFDDFSGAVAKLVLYWTLLNETPHLKP